MQIYLDSANLDDVKKANDLGVLDGVTTNPSLIAKEGVPYTKRLAEICKVVSGPVSAEVIATDFDGMLREGLEHSTIAPQIVVKLPSTLDGLKAILGKHFKLLRGPLSVPFVIRETRRKFQHTLSEVSIWERR
jgi:transaldolase